MLMPQPDLQPGAVSKTPFGTLPNGAAVELYTLSDGVITASISNYGARLVSVITPDRGGTKAEVALGHDSVDGYVADLNSYMGAIVGRYGNRLAGGSFTIDGVPCQVPLNNGVNALHGGPDGFDRKLWQTEISGSAVIFRLLSPDGDMGFPGTLNLAVTYTLKAGALRIDYQATTDKATVVNVTNHAYFNLAGEASGATGGDVLDHEVTLPAKHFTPVDAHLIPTGELQPVAGTPFDFTTPRRVGERIGADDVQLKLARGYDHNWASGNKGSMKLAAIVKDPVSGRVLTVETTEPGVQFYTGNFLDGSIPTRSKEGAYGFRSGFCLETQGYPDAPNHPNFPSTLLRPGEVLRSCTIFRFSVEG